NRKAGEMITPEINGVISPQDVAKKAIALIEDKDARASISKKLRQIMGEPGAAIKVIEEILGDRSSE
ncbi:MAG: hypothetical protein V1843_01785, partial [bacterium]